MFVFAFLSISLIISCEEEDERDDFVGTWTGILFFSRISTEYSATVTITKSTTNATQILTEINYLSKILFSVSVESAGLPSGIR